MRRLFWRFFIIIWLTMAGSVTVVFAVSSLLRGSPFADELARQKRDDLLRIASVILRQDGVDAAQSFARSAAIAELEVQLSISQVAPAADCINAGKDGERLVAAGKACYALNMPIPRKSLFATSWPKLVPWTTALCASIISAFWLARYLIGPVDHLRKGLSALANGHFDTRIGHKIDGRRDEVASLAHDFDISAARLETLQTTQQRLFHDVSHELRSPLSRLQAALGVLRQSPKKLEPMVERMDREIERMDQLVGEILTLARLNSGSIDEFDRQAIDIMDLLGEIVGDAAFEARTRGIVIKPSLPESFVARVNGELIYRALENVVRNALKYTRENSSVIIAAKVDGDQLHIEVTDEGPGIPESKIEKIFQPFARGDAPDTRDGFGLGLAIAKQALVRHGGSIAAIAPPSGGLKVVMTIPKHS